MIKLYSKIGQIAESEDGSYKGLHMPMDDAKNESRGFAFVEFLDKKVRGCVNKHVRSDIPLTLHRTRAVIAAHTSHPSGLATEESAECNKGTRFNVQKETRNENEATRKRIRNRAQLDDTVWDCVKMFMMSLL